MRTASRTRSSSPTTPSSTCSTRLPDPGGRPGQPVRQDELLDADLVRYAAAHQPQSDAVRCHRRHPHAKRAGTGRPHRRAADQRATSSFSSMCRPRAGSPPPSSSAISCCAPIRTARCCGSSDVARVEIGAQNLDSEVADRRPRGRADRDLSCAGRQCRDHRAGGAGHAAAAVRAVSRRAQLPRAVRLHDVRDATPSRRCCGRWAKPSSWW